MVVEAPIYTIRGAKLSFGLNPLFTDVDLYINRGDKICLVGRNGCGKSTLLSIIAGLTPVAEGLSMNNATIGYMLQRDELFNWLTIEKNALLPLEIKKAKTKE